MLNFFAITTRKFSYVLVAQEEIGPPELLATGGQLFYSFLVFGFVLILAYYLTKIVASKRMQIMNSKNIKVLEMVSMNAGVSLGIVQVGDKYFLVGMGKEKVDLISELEYKDLVFNEKGTLEYNFSEQFKKLLNKNNDKGKDDNDKDIEKH